MSASGPTELLTGILVAVIILCAALVQSLSGFGFALIIMPLMTIILGLRTAAPLVALVGLTVYSLNAVRYWRAINLGEVLRLGGTALFGVPVGIWVLGNVNESVVKTVLGIVLVTYAVYALLRPTAHHVLSPGWVYPAGFAAGCLGGAYNTPGPPAIVYGSLRQWPKDEFRATMQTLFFVNALLVVAFHIVGHRMTAHVLTLYLYAVPALVLGILAASRVDQRLDRHRFRALVSTMILVLGASLVLGVGN